MRGKTALSGKLKFAAIILVVVGLAALLLPNQKKAPANDGNVVRGDQYFVEEDFSPYEMLEMDSASVMVQTLAMDGSPQKGSESRVTLLSAQDDVGDAEFPITVITLRVTDLRGTPSVVTLRVLGDFGFITDKAEPRRFTVDPGEDEFSILFEFGGGFHFKKK